MQGSGQSSALEVEVRELQQANARLETRLAEAEGSLQGAQVCGWFRV